MSSKVKALRFLSSEIFIPYSSIDFCIVFYSDFRNYSTKNPKMQSLMFGTSRQRALAPVASPCLISSAVCGAAATNTARQATMIRTPKNFILTF